MGGVSRSDSQYKYMPNKTKLQPAKRERKKKAQALRGFVPRYKRNIKL